ncbi:hypothetical protein XM47_10860 [Catenovulum maritimum]|uniref:SIMPL domain-containing protein n=2 Tax=Catenovulum maritimum TaxID=1513271 RepID=A0A0J8GQG1_9ALTE|nr:hypothetical protein XM47_10860 [Catenovulum maritimum]
MASSLPDEPHVYVEGSASIDVSPDIVLFSIHLEEIDKDVDLAKEAIDKNSKALLSKSIELGIDLKNITSDSLRVQRKTRWEQGKSIYIGTSVSRNIKIKLTNIDLYSEVLSSLIALKISEDISSSLDVSDSDALTDKALNAAMEDARKRATMLAKSQGKTLGDVYSISEFNLRRLEKQYLNVSRSISGSHASILAEDIGTTSDYSIANALSRVSGISVRGAGSSFEPGTMVATAQIFVVYELE